ncbi:hypothetical protein J7643_03320 [bacterium]|nr:hypothetical protein [bacterium]
MIRRFSLVALLMATSLLTACNEQLLFGARMAADQVSQPARPVLGAENSVPLPSPTSKRLVAGWQHLHVYTNGDSNHCGQAAAAMMLAHADLNPLNLNRRIQDPVDSRWYASNADWIDGLTAKYPPDVLFGLAGTSPGRLVEMLEAFGMRTHFSTSADDTAGLERWVSAGWPVATLVDAQALWGGEASLHWIVVYGMDQRQVLAGNTFDGKRAIPLDKFRRAWECAGYPIHYAAVAAELP